MRQQLTANAPAGKGIRGIKTARLLAIMFAIASLSFGAGVASTYITVTADGFWWRDDVPADAKPFVLQGMVDAYTRGWESGVEYESGSFSAAISRKYGTALEPSMEFTWHVMSHDIAYGRPTFSKTMGYYEAAATDFYASRASSDNTTIGEVMGCLADKPVISCSDMAKLPHN